MTTMLDIVTRAHRKIGVGARDTPLEAHEAIEGNVELNSMLHEWVLRGVDTNHTDLDLTDDFPLSSPYEAGTVYLLASRLAPDFAVPASFDPDSFFRAIQAAYMVIDEVTVPNALKSPPSLKARYGTITYQNF